MEQKWDLFISHASEDKEKLVKPLAELLRRYGVRIWYDEFELKLGDSLSQRIDEGLRQAAFGLVVLSRSFFAKQWTDYELRSLLTRNIGGQRVILPVWHDIGKEDVQKYSLYLSDIKALSSDLGIEALAQEIIHRVRPDILDSHVRMEMCRRVERQPGPCVEVPREALHDSIYRHKTLPAELVISCRLMEEVFADVLETDYVQMAENFAKDWDYRREFLIWSAIANAYVWFIRETGCDFHDREKKGQALHLLLDYSLSGAFSIDEQRWFRLNPSEQVCLIKCYQDNRKHLNDMVEYWRDPEK